MPFSASVEGHLVAKVGVQEEVDVLYYFVSGTNLQYCRELFVQASGPAEVADRVLEVGADGERAK